MLIKVVCRLNGFQGLIFARNMESCNGAGRCKCDLPKSSCSGSFTSNFSYTILSLSLSHPSPRIHQTTLVDTSPQTHSSPMYFRAPCRNVRASPWDLANQKREQKLEQAWCRCWWKKSCITWMVMIRYKQLPFWCRILTINGRDKDIENLIMAVFVCFPRHVHTKA